MLKKFLTYTDEEFESMKKMEFLSLREMSAFSGIGYHTIERIYNDLPDEIILRVGKTRYLHRERFLEYLKNRKSI